MSCRVVSYGRIGILRNELSESKLRSVASLGMRFANGSRILYPEDKRCAFSRSTLFGPGKSAWIHVTSVMFENYSNATLFSPEYSEQYVCTGTSLVLCDVTVFWLECHQHFDPVMILKSDVLTLFLHEITFQKPGPRPISRFEHCRAEFSGYWSRRPYPGLRKNAMVVIL